MPTGAAALRSRPGSSYVVYLGFLAIFLFFAVMLRDSGFLTVRNLSNIVLQTAPITIMAIGLVFVLSAGEIDLSIGSTVAVSALSAAVALDAWGLVAGVLAGLGAGLAIGAAQRRAGRLSAAAVVPGHAGDPGPLRRRRPVAHRSALDPGDQTPAFTGFFGSGSAVRRAVAGDLDGGRGRDRASRLSRDAASAPMCWRPATTAGRRWSPASACQRIRLGRADAERRARRARRAALCRAAAGGEIHPRRDRPDDGHRRHHRRRHACSTAARARSSARWSAR